MCRTRSKAPIDNESNWAIHWECPRGIRQDDSQEVVAGIGSCPLHLPLLCLLASDYIHIHIHVHMVSSNVNSKQHGKETCHHNLTKEVCFEAFVNLHNFAGHRSRGRSERDPSRQSWIAADFFIGGFQSKTLHLILPAFVNQKIKRIILWQWQWQWGCYLWLQICEDYYETFNCNIESLTFNQTHASQSIVTKGEHTQVLPCLITSCFVIHS